MNKRKFEKLGSNNSINAGGLTANSGKMSMEMCEIVSTVSKRSSNFSVCTSASKANRTPENSIGPEIRNLWKKARRERRELCLKFSSLKI
jgi:hypothetical protein